ncbi:MAG: hypothetical protein M1561_04930 [Gammaproteobacteria bacterium]|nr:hypothetical protein [Gammaproteobacteria bacterium]
MKSYRFQLSIFLLSLIALFYSSQSFALDNDLKFINNVNFPLNISVNPQISTVINTCGGGTQNIEVKPKTISCAFRFLDSWSGNSGSIVIAKKNDPASFCKYNYFYEKSWLNYFKSHSENIVLEKCASSLKANEISIINDFTQSLARPLYFQKPYPKFGNGDIIKKYFESSESLSLADCAGSDNCIVISPNANTSYLPNGSTLREAILLQNNIDRFDSLNFAQFIGSHNSAISKQYTNSTNLLNLSYADPSSYLTLTEQLDLGLRILELDILWNDNAVSICDLMFDTSLPQLFCAGNIKLLKAILEIKNWLKTHRDAVIILYLDVHLPLTSKINNLDTDLSLLEPYIFTPKMAEQYYHVPPNTLPALQLTKNDLIKKFMKNIIVVNDNDVADLQNSNYIFTRNEQSTEPPLYHSSIDDFLSSKYAVCNGSTKYNNMKSIFPRDPNHFNMFRLNENRSIVSYIGFSGARSPREYIDYFTMQNLKNIQQCPFNIFSSDMLGFTCDTSFCKSHPTDTRLAAFLWSWELGYPLKVGGSDVAFIDPKLGHFKNDRIIFGKPYAVLCKRGPILKAPTQPANWYFREIIPQSGMDIYLAADTSCKSSGGEFAAPTSSYAMGDVMDLINENQIDNLVLVNYLFRTGEWIPNFKNTQF